MILTNIIKESFQEYEGHISLVLFSFGCNLRCKECYNLKDVLDPNKIIGEAQHIIGANLTPLHDAVVFLGGEPTVWADLPDVLDFVKSKDLKTKIYTNGLNPDLIKTINEKKLVDAYSVDFKTLNNPGVLGIDISLKQYFIQVNSTLQNIIRHNISLEIRTTRWTGVDVEQIQEFLSRYYPQIKHIIQDKFVI